MKLTDTPTIECHPPERRRRTEIRMCHGSACCCCCCCCLHTVGGIVGAAVAPTLGSQSTAWSHLPLTEEWEEEDYPSSPATGTEAGQEAITEKMPTSPARRTVPSGAVPNIAGSRISAVKVFWLLSLAAAVVGALIGAAYGGSGFVVGLVILALVFPAVQLGSAVLTLLWLAVSSRPDRSFQLSQVGKVTIGLVLGTLAGIVVMGVIGIIMSAVAAVR